MATSNIDEKAPDLHLEGETETLPVQGLPRPERQFTEAEEKKLYRKIDWRIMPILSSLYLLSFMDRGNIGNARLSGLQRDLSINDSQYNIALTVYFIPYCLFEVPSNLVLKKIKPSIWLSGICVVWGIVMTCMGVVQNYHGLCATRFFLGLAEAGLYPGVILYISIWYPRYMFQARAAVFFGSATIAGSFSGLLAYAIGFMDGLGGYSGWRWIFILEGLLTICVGALSYFVIVDFASEAKFLTEDEKRWVIWKKHIDSGQHGEAEHITMGFVKDALVNYQTLINTVTHFWGIVSLYGVALFMPTIINSFGKFTRPQVQLLTIPVYAVACAWVVICGIWADRTHKRYLFIMLNFGLVALGYVLNIAPVPYGVKYFGLFFCASGAYAVQPNVIAWLANNLSGQTKRAVGVAFEIGFSNFGAIIPSNTYFSTDAPHYYKGHGIIIGGAIFAMGTATVYALLLVRENRRKELYLQTPEHERQVYTSQEVHQLGDKHPAFIYTI